jgi:ribosome maturation factor RimP
MGMGIDRDRLRQVVQEAVEGLGYELVELELKGGGKNSVLRLFVDKPEGISHQDCALISGQVGTVLDVEDLIPFSYTLEVSSPGLDRKLIKDSDYTRFQGKKAKIQTRIPLQHQKAFKGRLGGLQDGKILLELSNGTTLQIPLDVVEEGRLEFDWDEERARVRGRNEE